MTEVESALAREAVACKHWEWKPGMRMIDAANGFNPCRVVLPSEGVRVTTLTHRLYRPTGGAQDAPSWPDWVPDFADPATVGCLLALVRLALNKPDLFVMRDGPKTFGAYEPGIEPTPVVDCCCSEVAALVAALKAAP